MKGLVWCFLNLKRIYVLYLQEKQKHMKSSLSTTTQCDIYVDLISFFPLMISVSLVQLANYYVKLAYTLYNTIVFMVTVYLEQ